MLSLSKLGKRANLGDASSGFQHPVVRYTPCCGLGIVQSASVLPKLRWLLDEADRVESEIKAEAGVVSGDVRLGLLPALSSPLVCSLLPRMRERHERVHMHFFEGSNGQLQEWLVNGAIDLAILYRYGDGGTLTERVLGTNDAHLIGPANSPLLQGDTVEFSLLEGLPMVLPNAPNPVRNVLDNEARRLGFRLNVYAEADSIVIQKGLAAAGQAFTILGSIAVDDQDGSQVSSARIVNPVIRRSAVLAISARKPLTTAMRVAFDEIEIIARQLINR